MAAEAGTAAPEPAAAADVTAAIESQLVGASRAFLTGTALPNELALLRSAYESGGYAPLWTRDGQGTLGAIATLHALRNADGVGLDPEDYAGGALTEQFLGLDAQPPAQLARFDLALSSALLRYMEHLHSGRIDPRSVGFDLRERRAPIPAAEVLRAAASTDHPEEVLARIEPPFHHYELLKQAIARYRGLASAPQLTELPALPARSVKPGESYAGAPALRRLLTAVGDFEPPAGSVPDSGAELLDEPLVEALKRFQARHGLEPDGSLGATTFTELTKPFAARATQVELTLERWRWLPELKTPPIIVNIPQFKLFAFRSTRDRVEDILQMSVIVGREYPANQTPVFSEDLSYLIFRPYWNVPPSIQRNEVVPAIRRRGAGYLTSNRMELVQGQGDESPAVAATPENFDALARGALRVRQRPGPDNALGLVKFMLPNAYNVYLHSTPAQQLFSRTRRAFSHGCIRVEDPALLAEHVLRNEPGDWTRAKADSAMQEGPDNRRVNLSQPIRVMILYGTAMATESGEMQFFPDIYGHDAKLLAALSAWRKGAATRPN